MIQKSNHLSKLSKRDKNRHFSHELWGGKGSHRRKYNPESEENYNNNPFWDAVEKERKLQQKEAEKRMMREEKARLSREICGN